MKQKNNEPVIQKPMKRAVSRRVMQDFKHNGSRLTLIEKLISMV